METLVTLLILSQYSYINKNLKILKTLVTLLILSPDKTLVTIHVCVCVCVCVRVRAKASTLMSPFVSRFDSFLIRKVGSRN
jgi:hypothetical protein